MLRRVQAIATPEGAMTALVSGSSARLQKAFLIVDNASIWGNNPFSAQNRVDLLGVASLPLCFLFCQHGDTMHSTPSFLHADR
ncbi:MAG: hypothetical protein ACLTZH_04245 [Subdoligranulum sp.]